MKKIENFAKIVDKTIPVDTDPSYSPSIQGETLFDEQLELSDHSLKQVYQNNQVRVILTKSEGLIETSVYNYAPEGNWQAFTFCVEQEEVKKLGGLQGFIYEVVTGTKDLYSYLGSSVSL